MILIIGALLRLVLLPFALPSLSQDELVTGYDSWCLSLNFHDHHGVFLPFMPEAFGDWTSPLINYISLPVLKIMGLSEYATRLPVSILGIASIYLFYVFILHCLGNKQTALIASFLFATAPFAISLSRWAIPPSTVPFALLLFLNSFFWALKKPSNMRFVIAGISAVVVVYSYPTMKLFFPPILLLLFVIYFNDIKWKWLPGGLLFIAFVSPLYYLALRYPEIYNVRFRSIALSASNEPLMQGFITRYIGYFTPYFYFGRGDEFMLHHVPGFGSIHEFLAFFSYAGLAAVIANGFKRLNFMDHKLSIFLLLVFLMAPIPASLTIHKYTLLRNIHTVLLMLVFAVIGIHFMLLNMAKLKVQKLLLYTVIIIISISTLNFSYYYFRQYKYDAQVDYHYGVKEVFAYLKDNEEKFTKVEINTSLDDDKGINEPYIYYLFYNKIVPGSYNTNTMTAHLGKYYFTTVNSDSLKDVSPVFVFPFGKDGLSYKIYGNTDGVYVVTK